tara:strand:+ start:198 stop:611 length:414 start_codon:yes stop_codon:yes gene_type:complete
MKKLTLLVAALMVATFSFAQQGSMTFAVNDLDISNPMASEANLGYFMTDDIMVSLSMNDWDNFKVGARYYGVCEGMFLEATTTATAEAGADSDYQIGAALGWTKDLGIWKLQFEPQIVLDDIQDFTPKLVWGLRFTL